MKRHYFICWTILHFWEFAIEFKRELQLLVSLDICYCNWSSAQLSQKDSNWNILFLYSKRFIIFFICFKFFLGIIKSFWEYIIRDFLLMLCRYIYLRIVGSAFCNNTMHYTIIIWLSHIHIHIQVCMLSMVECV